MNRTNWIVYLEAAVLAAAVLVALLLGATALGRRLERKRAWLIERGQS